MSHRAAFGAAAEAADLDIDAAQADGRLVVLDASETLAGIMVDGWPDVFRFEAVVGGLVRDAAASGRQIRVYGEMVALLWEAGNIVGAMELERLWNGLGTQLPFTLFCAYPEAIVSGIEVADAFAEVCNLHSEVIGGAPTPTGTEVTRRFAGTQHAPFLVRCFVTETLRRWGLDEMVDDCAAVASELATNAVVHDRSDLTVGVSRCRGGVRLAVGDASCAPPLPRVASSTEGDGRGLVLVEAIATRWGHHTTDDGKVVWAEIGVKKRVRSTTFEISRRSLLLVLLEHGPRHGWGLAEDLVEATGEHIDRPSVYRALHALEGEGLVSSRWAKSEGGGAKKRSYRLTRSGRVSATASRADLERTIARLESLLAR